MSLIGVDGERHGDTLLHEGTRRGSSAGDIQLSPPLQLAAVPGHCLGN